MNTIYVHSSDHQHHIYYCSAWDKPTNKQASSLDEVSRISSFINCLKTFSTPVALFPYTYHSHSSYKKKQYNYTLVLVCKRYDIIHKSECTDSQPPQLNIHNYTPLVL